MNRRRRQADDAMTTLARERGKALTGYAFLLTGTMGDAEDLVQDALVTVFERVRGTQVPADESHVRRAILNLYIDRFRRRRHWLELRHLVARTDRLDRAHDRTAQRVDVEAALRSLPPQQRACIVLRFYDDLTVPEIADRLSLADGTVKRYLSVAVHRMEALLGPVTPMTPTETVLVDGGRR